MKTAEVTKSGLTNASVKALYDKYIMRVYSRVDVAICKGKGTRVWDVEGRQYLDMFPGWGAAILGHCHPAVVEAIKKQAETLIHVTNNFYQPNQALLGQIISDRSFGGRVFFGNSGAEVVEAAFKFARIHQQATHKGKKKYKIICMLNSFHGRTLAAATATGQDKYHTGFDPLPGGFEYVPYNDFDAIAKIADDETCAIIMEPVQGEGGVIPANADYLKKVRQLCDEKKILLIFDEVQSCGGRLGEFFAQRLFGITPDIMTAAKAIAGGMAIGMVEVKPEIADSVKMGMHGTTFGGNAMACAAGLAVFKAIDDEKLMGRVERIGKLMRDRFQKISDETGKIKEVRGRGMMLGCVMNMNAEPLIDKCRENGLLINCAHDTVIRFLPPLNVDENELNEAFDIFAKTLKAYKG